MPSPQPEIPTPTPQKPTSTFTPTSSTFTPIKTVLPPTSIASATATINPPLLPEGPYLAYLKGEGEQKTIVFMNSDGVGRKEILLPADISRQTYDLNGLSPDGKWLAYYTGEPEVQYPYKFPPQGPYDLALNLFNLDTRESVKITRLLSEDFPDNFQQQADIFVRTGIPDELQIPDADLATILYGTFLNGIRSGAWSPDARYLAFAGQMNGLSSDLYVYDMQSQQIRQLSSGSEEIQWISWSPDGKSILHASTYWVGMAMECRTYVADLDGTSVRYLSKNINCITPDTWLNDHIYLEYDSQNVIGEYNLRAVDTRTGGIGMYWEGGFGTYAVDVEKGLIVINPITDSWPFDPNRNFIRGLYIITIANGKNSRIDDGMWNPQFFGLGERRFVVLSIEIGKKNYFLGADGMHIPIEGEYRAVFAAPNHKYWVGIDKKTSIFDKDDNLVREIAFPKRSENVNSIELVTWSPDASGFYLVLNQRGLGSNNPCYFINLLNGEPLLVENNWMYGYLWNAGFKWISP